MTGAAVAPSTSSAALAVINRVSFIVFPNLNFNTLNFNKITCRVSGLNRLNYPMKRHFGSSLQLMLRAIYTYRGEIQHLYPKYNRRAGEWPSMAANSQNIIIGFINLLHTHALLVTIEHPFPSLPDPDDKPIVTSALAGNANVFVTGDKALLQLHNVEHLPVVSPRNFWEMLAGR
jgi:hypothetical protein